MKVAEALAYGRQQLAGGDSPDIDSVVLLCHVLQCEAVRLHTWPEQLLTDEQLLSFKTLIEQRRQGKPVAYLIGQRGFWSLNLTVNEHTLIPRPDTELLVSLALQKLDEAMCVADLGTGSGAIALALAAEMPSINMFATDYSLAALQTARHNAQHHQLHNVHFIQSHWLAAFQSRAFDLIVSNPPYIASDDPHLSEGDVRFEPLSALAAGKDGLDDLRLIVEQSASRLKAGGWLLVEHGFDQSQAVQQLFTSAGFESISAHQDFGGNDRVVMGQLTL